MMEEAAVGGEAVIAEPSQRVVARLVDTLIVGVPVATVASELFPRQTAQTVVAPIAFAALFFVYEAVQVILWGRTIGKRLTGIKIVSADGRPLRAYQTLARTAIYALPPAARPLPVLNVFAALFWIADVLLVFEGTQRQALHDRVAGTLVVDVRSGASHQP
jgi:uncharacterized RDD family membrane protein YckC